jgi:hypothetical protein
MSKQLTPEQIENLFEFCEFHDVVHYDVQIELVDHLASAIEELWLTNPDLPFDDAVFQIAEQFGVEPYFHASYQSLLPSIMGSHSTRKSGFEAIKEAKEIELRRKYERIQWKYIQEFFRLPKIILTATVVAILFCLFRFSENDLQVSLIIIDIYILSFVAFLTLVYPKKNRLILIPGKSFLLYDHFKAMRRSILSAGFMPITLFSLYLNGSKVFDSNWTLTNSIIGELLYAFFITLFFISMIVMAVYVPQRIKEDFTREFPQFVKV